VIETERLHIRPLTLDDAPFILALVTQPSWLRFIGDKGVTDVASAERYLREGPIAMQARHGFALQLVVLKEGATPIGICGLLKRDSLPDPDLGFALLDAYEGRGYAFEAASAIMQMARTTLGLRRVMAIATPDNARSAALLERLGFTPQGTLDAGALVVFVAE
jgi:RimJ/RimL family protein N-acetyltransferase